MATESYDLKDIQRRARQGAPLTDQEQGRLCLACAGTGDACWEGTAIICQRKRCKYRSSRPSRYFRERRRLDSNVGAHLDDQRGGPESRGKDKAKEG